MMSKQGKPQKGDKQPATVSLEILVEEESAAEALRPVVAKILDGKRVRIGFRKFRGKPDLIKNLPDRLKGYATARRRGEDVRIVVLVDRDNDDHADLKDQLDKIAITAGLIPHTEQQPGVFNVLSGIAVRELESWYFGDWPAVRAGFPKAPAEPPRSHKGNPDQTSGKCSDAFEKMLLSSGVRIASKPEWGRRIGPHLALDGNRSPSFSAFISGVQAITAE
ncbi:DUF4276 family protein [Streptomyces sp. NPDC051567]|uniref:DUF4276 family protein n=1 Tax=Streptomyces sp. NPDC051567 TaxID=3365660 RepID=UPI0037AE8309